MRSLLFFFMMITACITSYSQASDFLSVRKRNNRTLKTYFPGSAISLQSVYGNFHSGIIENIHHDSVFIRQYDVRAIPNQWGVSQVDTLGSYLIALHYKDIETVSFSKRKPFGFITNGSMLMIGGLGYIGLNLINGKYLKQPLSDTENRKSLAIALGVAGTGFALSRIQKYSNRNGKRYNIIYVRMNVRPSV